MEKLRKIFMILSLSTLGIACVMLIMGVFGLPIFSNDILLKILLTAGTLSVGSGVAINEIAVIKRKRVLGYVGLVLLSISVVLALILILTPLLSNPLVVRITAIISVSSIMFITIISQYSKLGSSNRVLQVFTYIAVVTLDVLICLLIAGVNIFEWPAMIEIFAVLCIVSVGLLIAINVVSSKMKNQQPEIIAKSNQENLQRQIDEDKMIISKAEYYTLKEENQRLKEQKVDEDKMIISKADYYSLKEENLKLKEELIKLKQSK